MAVLLLLSGYVSSQARLASTAADGARQGLVGQPEQATEAIGELLRTVADAERFPALHTALVDGAFAPVEDQTYAPFELGLNLMLDGINQLMNRPASEPAPVPAEPK